MKNLLPVVFGLGTAICWGLYGPTLGQSRSPERLYSPFKPYVGIGLAYIVWAFIGGMIAMYMNQDSFSFSGSHQRAGVWGFLAGTLGALGALSLTTAMFKGGAAMPQVVMPVVFGGAVTVTAIATVIQQGGTGKTSPLLWVGIVGTALSIVLVAANTPHAGPHTPAAGADHSEENSAATDSSAPDAEQP